METTIRSLAPGVYAMDQGMVRCFLITGCEGALLLDTGAEPCGLPALVRSLTDLPLTVVQTHGDGDHTAGSDQFDKIFAHPAEFDVICKFRPQLWERLLPIREGDIFDLGGRVLEVIEAPGHTPGSICLLDRNHRALFAGDTLSYGPVFLFGDHRDVPAYRATLEKLRALPDYDTVYPCHNTCPVDRSVIGELLAAVDGALDGSIAPAPVEGMPMPEGARPDCYRYGRCGILYIKPENQEVIS